MLAIAALVLAAAGAVPSSATSLVFSVRDYAGKPAANVVLSTAGPRMRAEGFGRVMIFDGQAWRGDPPGDAEAGLAALLAFAGRQGVVRSDYAGRPLLVADYPAGSRKARIDFRYDETGIVSANLVLSDGSGYQLRRVAAASRPFDPSEFEPPSHVEAVPTGVAPALDRAPDGSAVERLFAIEITDRDLADFQLERGSTSATGAAKPPAPTAAEIRSGREAAAKLFARDGLAPDPRLLRYVNLLGRSLAAAPFRFAVTEAEAPYALKLPGSVVAVSRGALSLIDSEAELAVVLAREICRGDADSDSLADPRWDGCGSALASSRGYDAAAFLHLLETLADRAASAREKADARDRIQRFKTLPEYGKGGQTLAERFRRSVVS